jgi:hypothetical protein
VGLDNILLDENIESLPEYDDDFKVSYIDQKTNLKMQKVVKVGEGLLMDKITG